MRPNPEKKLIGTKKSAFNVLFFQFSSKLRSTFQFSFISSVYPSFPIPGDWESLCVNL